MFVSAAPADTPLGSLSPPSTSSYPAELSVSVCVCVCVCVCVHACMCESLALGSKRGRVEESLHADVSVG